MNWAFALLELEHDADERAVKRAYAKRLRITRPDDDPVAFQQLHEAYQTALHWAQERLEWEQEAAQEPADAPSATDAGTHTSAEPATALVPPVVAVPPAPHDPALPHHEPTARVFETAPPATAQSTALPLPELPVLPPRIDAAMMCRLILAEAHSADPASLDGWLQRRPELWSLQDKPRIGAALVDHLFSHDEAMRLENFDVLVRCFGWDEVGHEVDPFLIQRFRQRVHRNWMLHPAGAGDLARHLRGYGRPVSAVEAGKDMQRLTRPWRPWQALWSALPPARASRMNRMLQRLGIDEVADAPPPLQPAQVTFWMTLRDYRQLSPVRLQLAALQGTVLGLSFLLLMLAIWALLELLAPSAADASRLPGFLRVGLYGGGLLFGIRMAGPLGLAVLRWISADEQPKPPLPVLQRWLIPLAAAASLLLILALDARVAGSIIAWLALALAVARHWRRGRHVYRWKMPARIWLLTFFLVGGLTFKMLTVLFSFSEVVAVAALGFWARDAWLRIWPRR